MKIVLDLKNSPSENDILVYNKGVWVCVNKDKVLDPFRQEIKELKQEVENYKVENEKLKKAVNEKLKSYHDILQQLVKED